MRVVLIDSPGPGVTGSGAHWSTNLVSDLEARLAAAGAGVRRLSPTLERQLARHQVTPAITDIAAEAALTQMLRDEPAHAVVHAGVGAAGSPNLLWIAARMGSVGIAVVRASEVVCQRGDLVHQDGAACAKFDDGDRCAACCSGSWFRRARAVDLLNRLDLFVAGLQSSALVLLPTADDPAVLEAVGVPKRSLRTAAAEDLAATVASELPELVATVAFRGD